MRNFYPLFVALIGLAISALCTERALALMKPDEKAALVDASARTRLMNILVAGLFVALVLWRPLIGWVFLGCAYFGLLGRSLIRLRRLSLPSAVRRLLLAGNVAATFGIGICALIFALRSVR
jgi:hypothetical protein